MDRLPPPPLPRWLDPLVPFERFSVEVEGHRLHVMTQGEGRPVLLLHGNPTWGFLWRKVAEALAGEPLRLIMPDLVGLGFSDKPKDASAHTLANHGRWIGALVDGLDLDGLVLVGQDWGGPIAVRALADRPERLAGVVLLNTVVGPPKEGFRPTAFHRFARMPLVSDLVFRGLGFPQRMLSIAQHDKASISGVVSRAYAFPLKGLGRNVAPLALARMVPDRLDHPSVPDLERCQATLEAFDGPAALVWGLGDPILGRLWRRAQRVLPQAPLTQTDAGHFLQEEVPHVIAGAIRDVARRLG